MRRGHKSEPDGGFADAVVVTAVVGNPQVPRLTGTATCHVKTHSRRTFVVCVAFCFHCCTLIRCVSMTHPNILLDSSSVYLKKFSVIVGSLLGDLSCV